MRATDGYGVDVVLNSLSGQGMLASWDCIAPYGRFVDIGKSDIMANSPLPMAKFAKNVTFSSVNLHHIVLTNNILTRQLVEKVLSLIADQDFGGGPVPLHAVAVSDVQKAFRYMQSGENTGRITVDLTSNNEVPKSIPHKNDWHFDADALYLVAGGLGGVGRRILLWRCDRGAKNMIVPSRSGISSQAALDVISELKSKGVNAITPRCDVLSSAELADLLHRCADMPLIKGCINLAMVLQDAVFEYMTHAQWAETIRTKVYSSWNLHRLLPHDMDFFILMSSLAGIYGLPSQSNYAAGSSFLDALASMRATQEGFGTTVSLDLGWMQSIGIIAERAEYRRIGERTRDMVTIRTGNLLALLEHYCDPMLPRPTPEQSQILIGLSTPADSHARSEVRPSHLQVPLFAPFDIVRSSKATRQTSGEDNDDNDDAVQRFWQANDVQGRSEAVVQILKSKLVVALGVQPEDIDLGIGLADHGVDSLMAIELRNLFWQSLQVSVAVFEIMGAKTFVVWGKSLRPRLAQLM
ncbi:KR-domain-containing protein [Byssothecium circinans]|uniref:KR-domain-containing protein n=1 Tax=Byssothecium circinans TaxID=147558 RepID=A0A6A5TCD9_9PLEO|nr:KR-domain-containing protein [Byssothecium circinans]